MVNGGAGGMWDAPVSCRKCRGRFPGKKAFFSQPLQLPAKLLLALFRCPPSSHHLDARELIKVLLGTEVALLGWRWNPGQAGLHREAVPMALPERL